ncbi:Armadillo/beta-catenin-like repeat protein [Nitzschia inconspicua]|uniref:Armadillo/beta-catenin-like repeat protein n=1 Tax=Nitzschia inconspicua TaxID=303405 RepID=A0A9K3Q656_9STRA|nr:Armadillo/beta-catenin-like repeat protein [Nitzschia inconspicua]
MSTSGDGNNIVSNNNGYVPKKLRGVMGSCGSQGGGGGAYKSRLKGRKSRPWRVDAASWKQELQERKAVYDNFALPEADEEEKKIVTTANLEGNDQQNEGIVSSPLGSSTTTTNGGMSIASPKKSTVPTTTDISPWKATTSSPEPLSPDLYTPRSYIDRFHASFAVVPSPTKCTSPSATRNSSEGYRNAASSAASKLDTRSPIKYSQSNQNPNDNIDDDHELLSSRSTEDEDDDVKRHVNRSFEQQVQSTASEESPHYEPPPTFRMASAEEVSNIGFFIRQERERERAEQEQRMEEMRRLHASPGLVSAIMRSTTTTTTTVKRDKETSSKLIVETMTTSPPGLEPSLSVDDYDDDGILASRSPVHSYPTTTPSAIPIATDDDDDIEEEEEDIASDASVASEGSHPPTTPLPKVYPSDDLLTIRPVPTDEEEEEVDTPMPVSGSTFLNFPQTDQVEDDIEDDVQSLVAEALCAIERATTMTEDDDATVKSELMASALSAIETAAAMTHHPTEHPKRISSPPSSPVKRRILLTSPSDAKSRTTETDAAPPLPILSSPNSNKEVATTVVGADEDFPSHPQSAEKEPAESTGGKSVSSPASATIEDTSTPAQNPDPLQRARKGLLISDLGKGLHKSPTMKDAQVIETISDGARESIKQELFRTDEPTSTNNKETDVPLPSSDFNKAGDAAVEKEEDDSNVPDHSSELVTCPIASEDGQDNSANTKAPLITEEQPVITSTETLVSESAEEGSETIQSAVDDLEVAKKLIFNEMTSRLKSVYTGDYHCIESTGNPELYKPPKSPPEPGAATKSSGSTLYAELNARISAMFTNHHHIVESPFMDDSKKGVEEEDVVAASNLPHEEEPNEWIPITPHASSTNDINKFPGEDTDPDSFKSSGEDKSFEETVQATSPERNDDASPQKNTLAFERNDVQELTDTPSPYAKKEQTATDYHSESIVDPSTDAEDIGKFPLHYGNDVPPPSMEIVTTEATLHQSPNGDFLHTEQPAKPSMQKVQEDVAKIKAFEPKREDIVDGLSVDQQKSIDFVSEIAFMLGKEMLSQDEGVTLHMKTEIDATESKKSDSSHPSEPDANSVMTSFADKMIPPEADTTIVVMDKHLHAPVATRAVSLMTGDIASSVLVTDSELPPETTPATEHSEDESELQCVEEQNIIKYEEPSSYEKSEALDSNDSGASKDDELFLGTISSQTLHSDAESPDSKDCIAGTNGLPTHGSIHETQAVATTPDLERGNHSPNTPVAIEDGEVNGKCNGLANEATQVEVNDAQLGAEAMARKQASEDELSSAQEPIRDSACTHEGASLLPSNEDPECAEANSQSVAAKTQSSNGTNLVGIESTCLEQENSRDIKVMTPIGNSKNEIKSESGKGKKWKDRLANKRASKSNHEKNDSYYEKVEEGTPKSFLDSPIVSSASPTITEDTVIQGIPPNKGKKWKDRIAKKRGRKCFSGNDFAGDGGETTSPITPLTSRVSITGSAISDISLPPDDQPILSPSSDSRKSGSAPSPKPGSSIKSKKWKDRLARRRSMKDSVSNEDRMAVEYESSNADMTGRTIVTIQSGDEEDVSPDTVMDAQISSPPFSNANSDTGILSTRAAQTDDVLGMEDPVEETLAKDKFHGSKSLESDELNNSPKIQNDLRTSFKAFDAILNQRPTLAIDEQSVWTEVTVEQATVIQPVNSSYPSPGDDASYMELTVDESVQHSYIEETVVSEFGQSNNAGPPDNPSSMMSPFMSSLLSSRLYQDMAPTNSNQHPKNLTDHLEQHSKSFPTIMVNSAHDDDMTQITMDHSLDDEDDHEDANPEPVQSREPEVNVATDNKQEKFYDAVCKPSAPPERPPIVKIPSGRSRRSLKSLKSSGEGSASSQISSETSKQRISEILRRDVWSRDSGVVQVGLEELAKKAKQGRKYRAHIVRCGGIMAITRTMEINADDDSVQIACCKILEHLALDPETQSAICEMAGISLIVRSMQDHADNSEVQEVACSALATICRREEAEDIKDSIREAHGAVYTLLTSMTRYSDNRHIQAKAFAAIANLCMESRERLAELSEAGGIMTMTLALQKQWENKTEQHEAISSLSILLRGITELNALPSPKKVQPREKMIDDDSSLETQSDTSMASLTEEKGEEVPAPVELKQDGTSRTSNETESMSPKAKEVEKETLVTGVEHGEEKGDSLVDKNVSCDTSTENGDNEPALVNPESNITDDSLESLEAIPRINTMSTKDEDEEKVDEAPQEVKSQENVGEEDKKEDQCVIH